MAGYSDLGEFLFDTHANPVYSEVWELFRYTVKTKGIGIPVLIEWDEEIPDLKTLEQEAITDKEILMEGAHDK